MEDHGNDRERRAANHRSKFNVEKATNLRQQRAEKKKKQKEKKQAQQQQQQQQQSTSFPHPPPLPQQPLSGLSSQDPPLTFSLAFRPALPPSLPPRSDPPLALADTTEEQPEKKKKRKITKKEKARILERIQMKQEWAEMEVEDADMGGPPMREGGSPMWGDVFDHAEGIDWAAVSAATDWAEVKRVIDEESEKGALEEDELLFGVVGTSSDEEVEEEEEEGEKMEGVE